MIRVRPVVVGVVFAVLVSLLGGCSLFEDDPQTQLDKIITAIGTENILAVDIHATQKTARNERGAVGVTWVQDGQLLLTWVDERKIVTEKSGYSSFAASPTSISKFSLDRILDMTKKLINDDTCTSLSATSMATPAGSVGTWAECTGRGGGQQHVVDEQSMLDGGLFYVPRVDPQVAADLDALRQAYVTVMGTSKVHRFSYYFNQALLSLDGPVATNALGESCVPSMTALLSSSSTPFPVSCDTKATVGSNPFDVNEFSSTSVAEVVASVENSQILDYQSLVSITFFHQGEDLCWEVTTTSIGDLSAHRDQLKGCITKGA